MCPDQGSTTFSARLMTRSSSLPAFSRSSNATAARRSRDSSSSGLLFLREAATCSRTLMGQSLSRSERVGGKLCRRFLGRSVFDEGRAVEEAGAGAGRVLHQSGGGGAGGRLRRGGGGAPDQGGLREAPGCGRDPDPPGLFAGDAGALFRARKGAPLRGDAARCPFDVRGC